jgi:HEAT repeat protein
LRAREHFDPSDAFLELALLDHHEAVRYLAMTLLRKRHPERAFGEMRKRALAILASPETPARELVGALGALADVGLAGDAKEVARFLEDPRPRVRAEAARTSSMLRVSVPPRAKA